MKTLFKTRLIRTIAALILGFFALFLFRFIYGYTTGLAEMQEEVSSLFGDMGAVKKNYASDSYSFTRWASQGTPTGLHTKAEQFDVDQKYEKTATVKTRTKQFENDEKYARATIKKFNSIIQFEKNAGRKVNRSIFFLIGAPPDKFDSLYADLQKIGTVLSKEIVKIDKTSEFKNLNARKNSLETTRQSLLEIRKQSGKIDEYINLQNRILEIEQELQSLGVQLGDFSEENEFCTVRLSLSESQEIKISFLHRVKVAFEWAAKYYLMLLGITAFAATTGFFLLLIVDKLLPSIINRINQ